MKFRATLVVVVALGALAACGDDEPSASDASSTPTASETSAEPTESATPESDPVCDTAKIVEVDLAAIGGAVGGAPEDALPVVEVAVGSLEDLQATNPPTELAKPVKTLVTALKASIKGGKFDLGVLANQADAMTNGAAAVSAYIVANCV